MQGLGRGEQARSKQHLLRLHRAERVYQVLVIVEGQTIAQRPSDRHTEAGSGSGVPQIADRRDDQTGADGIAVNGCNRWLGMVYRNSTIVSTLCSYAMPSSPVKP